MIIENNYGYKLNLVGEVEKIDNKTIEELKKYNDTIYFNNSTCKYWMFDFKINGLWFSSKSIDLIKNEIIFEVFE